MFIFYYLFFRNDSLQFHRVYEFVHREITAIMPLINSDLTERGINLIGITNCTMRTFIFHEIRCSDAIRIITVHLRELTNQFVNEVYNFASSLFNLYFYDRNVQYLRPDGTPAILYYTTVRKNKIFYYINYLYYMYF